MPDSSEIPHRRKILLLICAVYFAAMLWGFQKDLPLAPEVDEPIFVIPAVKMASSGSLDPGYYGHPASTTYYPLAAIYQTWHFLKYQGRLLHADPNLLVRFQDSWADFYLLGRFLTIIYALLSVFLVYQIGRKTFGSDLIGLYGAGLSIFYPVYLFMFQFVRTDSSGLFFGLLTLWFCLLTYEKPSSSRQILCGLSLGLAIASRFFMVTLIPAYISANFFARFFNNRSMQNADPIFRNIFLGLSSAGLIFILTTPFLFINSDTAITDLLVQGRSTQLGWDGLSPPENLFWYLTNAIPQNLTWPQMSFAVIGIVFVITRRQAKPILLLVFIASFLIGISLSPLHWERWIIQILPLFSLFAVYGIFMLHKYILTKPKLFQFDILRPQTAGSRQSGPVLLWVQENAILIGVLLLSIWPVVNSTIEVLSKSGPSTRVLARDWIVEHLPPQSSIVQDKYAALLHGTDFRVFEQSWAPPDHTMDYYLSNGYEYYAMNLSFYEYLLAEPDRYSEELEFYEHLFEFGEVLVEIKPSRFNEGSTILIHKLSGS